MSKLLAILVLSLVIYAGAQSLMDVREKAQIRVAEAEQALQELHLEHERQCKLMFPTSPANQLACMDELEMEE